MCVMNPVIHLVTLLFAIECLCARPGQHWVLAQALPERALTATQSRGQQCRPHRMC